MSIDNKRPVAVGVGIAGGGAGAGAVVAGKNKVRSAFKTKRLASVCVTLKM